MELAKAKSLRPRRSPRAKDEERLPFRSCGDSDKRLLQGLEEPEALVRRLRRKSECGLSTMNIE